MTHENSIAVLPFADMSADPGNEYFSDGISEEIINALTKVSGLFVASRTSAFAFRDSKEDVREIARKLNVRSVLEGSVRKAGNRLRITAQLIKADDGFHLWSERFDRELADVFAIQDEIALSIVNGLRVRLVGEEKDAIGKRATENLEAYNAFLQGRHFLNKMTHDSLRKAIERFEEALSLSPHYAQACALMANAYHLLAFMDYCAPHDVHARARAYALKSIEIDPTFGEGHAIVAVVKEYFEWDWAGAEAALEKALALSPNDAGTRVKSAYHQMWLGRMDQACAEITKAHSLDPFLDPAMAGIIYIRAGKYREARARFRESLESEPDRAHSLWFLGHLDVLERHFDEGLALIRRAVTLSGHNAMILAGLGWSYATAGEKGQAHVVLDELRERAKVQYIRPYFFAKIYSALGEKDTAFEWLDRACQDHDMSLVHVLNDESLVNLHGDPRFIQILRKVGLAQ
jgi:TolB-like protein/Flp pilus assembly protein TadD